MLVNVIEKHNQAYREGRPEISDTEYDLYIKKLHELDPNNDWFNHPEPGVNNKNRKTPLPIPMKSLNKAKSLAELQSWAKSLALQENTTLVITPKFDGLSLLYNETTGKAYSRGGSENEGQDCTEHFKAAGIFSPKETGLHYTFGEFVFSCQSWERNFKDKTPPETGEKYKSPRNTAAGFLNRDVPSKLLKYVDFFRYGTDETSLMDFLTYSELINFLCCKYKQFQLYTTVKLKYLTEESLSDIFKEWSKIYYIDGLVLYIDDLNLWKIIGRHQSTGNPLYAIAYKHASFANVFVTVMKGISWKVNKSGALKPVINIESVDTGDCSMENPTGYNAGWVCDAGIAKGAKILVTRSGGVIPKILSTIEEAPAYEQEEMWDALSLCPHCGEPTKWSENGIELYCVNPECNGIKLAKIVFFYAVTEVEGMKEATIAKIFNAGFTNIPAILNITEDQLMKIEKFGKALTGQVLKNNRKIMAGMDMATLMHASNCFKNIGKVKAQKILDEMSDEERDSFYQWKNMWRTNESMSKTQKDFVSGIESFFDFLKKTGIHVLPPEKKHENTLGKCVGMSVCFSGIRNAELEEKIINEGGKITGGVSKNTTLLIVKDLETSSTKITKAQILNIPIIAIDKFQSSF